METKKTLEVNCAICDARNITAETLAAYEKVEINCATLFTGPKTQPLLSEYHVELNAATIVSLAEDIQISTFNGTVELTPGQAVPEKKLAQIVNGVVDVAPGCEALLRNYAALVVNGKLTVPESLSGLLENVTVNGCISTYPDGCVRLKSNMVLDRTFPLRARKDAHYYAANSIAALDPDIDFGKLAEKNVRFTTKKLTIAEGLVEAAMPLFDERVDVTILPDGCAYVNDDATLDETLVLRYGGKLYIDGDLTAAEDGPWLEQVSYLQVNGDLLATREMLKKLKGVDLRYQDLYLVGGTLFNGWASASVSRAALENAETGLSAVSCAQVTIEEDVPPELLREKLVSLVACACVTCTKEQTAAVELVAKNCSIIRRSDEETGGDGEEDSNCIQIEAAIYTF